MCSYLKLGTVGEVGIITLLMKPVMTRSLSPSLFTDSYLDGRNVGGTATFSVI